METQLNKHIHPKNYKTMKLINTFTSQQIQKSRNYIAHKITYHSYAGTLQPIKITIETHLVDLIYDITNTTIDIIWNEKGKKSNSIQPKPKFT